MAVVAEFQSGSKGIYIQNIAMLGPLDLHITISRMIWIKLETDARHADLLHMNSSFTLCIQLIQLLPKKYKVNTTDPISEKCQRPCFITCTLCQV
jgi:hypothetical protein